jgi:hypothetical protein
MRLRRRVLLWSFVAASCGIAALGLRAFWLEPASLQVVEERITVPWSAGPLRIAVLSDLHVGSPFNGVDKLRDVVDRTNAAMPDLVCILGDLVIQGVAGGRFVSPEDIAAELKRLRADAGVFGVLGNHDGWLNHDRVAAALETNGIRLVEDRSELVQTRAGPIWLAGLSDLWTGRHDLRAALEGIANGGAPVILLTHNPHSSAARLADAGRSHTRRTGPNPVPWRTHHSISIRRALRRGPRHRRPAPFVCRDGSGHQHLAGALSRATCYFDPDRVRPLIRDTARSFAVSIDPTVQVHADPQLLWPCAAWRSNRYSISTGSRSSPFSVAPLSGSVTPDEAFLRRGLMS